MLSGIPRMNVLSTREASNTPSCNRLCWMIPSALLMAGASANALGVGRTPSGQRVKSSSPNNLRSRFSEWLMED